MNIGDQVVLLEAVVVFDVLGQDLLLAGTEGEIVEIYGDLLTVETRKGVYDSVPVRSVSLKMKEKAA